MFPVSGTAVVAVVLIAAAVRSGISIVIVPFAFAIVDADGLLGDGDAFLGRTCVEGGAENDDCCCNQQRNQVKKRRLAHLLLPIDPSFDAVVALGCESVFVADLGISLRGSSRRMASTMAGRESLDTAWDR